MIIFSTLFVLVAITLAVTTIVNGFDVLNLHLTCYGLILLCVGYLIDLNRRQKVEDIRSQIEWILDKKYGSLSEEIKGLRTLFLNLEERKLKSAGGTESGLGNKKANPLIEASRRQLEIELDKLPKPNPPSAK